MFVALCVGIALVTLALSALVQSADAPRSRFSRNIS